MFWKERILQTDKAQERAESGQISKKIRQVYTERRQTTMKKGRVTIPTNLDVVPQTLEILDEWGADAIRDCAKTNLLNILLFAIF